MSSRARAGRVAALVLALGVVGGAVVLSVTRGTERGDGQDRAPVVASASTRWPAETLEDWVTFADQVSTLTVIGERRLPIDDRAERLGEGAVGREVTAVIRSTLWAYDAARVVRGTVRFRTWGWVLRDGELLPTVPEGEVRLEVGDEVVAPLLRTPEGDFGPVAPHAVIHVVAGRATVEGQQARAYPALRDLDLRSLDELEARLGALKVDPRLRRLDPDERAREIASRR